MSSFEVFKNCNARLLRVYRSDKRVCSCKLKTACTTPGKHPAPWNNPDYVGARGQQKYLTNNGVYNAKADWSEDEFDGYNVGVATGNGLLVIDIDPRNSGHLTWSEIVKDKDVPNTLVVATGGGGTHIYLTVPESSGIRSFSFEGIDFQYNGKYVIAPPSIHPSGTMYEWEDCNPQTDAPAQCPKWLLEWIISKLHESNSTILPAGSANLEPASWEWEWIDEILAKLNPDIPHDEWIGVGMGLHSTGNPEALHKWVSWSAGGEKYRIGECEKRWKTFKIKQESEAFHSYRWIFHLAKVYGLEYENKSFFADWSSGPQKVDYTAIVEAGGSLIKQLYEVIESSAFTDIPEFGLATALQIMSSIAQGSYLTPTGGSLNLYQWLAAPAGTGKDSFYKISKQICNDVQDGLVCDDMGSVHGLRNLLFAWNSRVYICDEFHDLYAQMVNPKNVFQRALLKEFKQLWNMPSMWDGSQTKQSSSPRIHYPVLSLFCFSTVRGLETSADPEFLSSGLGSRYLFWPVERKIALADHSPAALSPSLRDALRKIVAAGLTKEGEMQISVASEMSRLHEHYNKPSKPIVHNAQCIASKMLEDCSEGWFKRFRADCWTKSQEFHGQRLEDHGNMWSRVAQMTERVASLRALSDARTKIVQSDYEWSKEIVEMSLSTALKIFTNRQRVTYGDEDVMRRCDAVERRITELYLEVNRPLTKTEIVKHNNSSVRISVKNIDDALVNLVQMGRILCLSKQGLEITPTSAGSVPWGATWLPRA